MINLNKLKSLANKIFEDNSGEIPVNVEQIAKNNEISIEYMEFKSNKLDGLLVFYSGKSKIFLNSNIVKNSSYYRTRFTIAHELGHYFIDEHRQHIIDKGSIFSETEYQSSDEMEKEADFFASCLLMPDEEFKSHCLEPFSPKLIFDLSEIFNVSRIATLFRYFKLNMHPMCLFIIVDGKVKYFYASDDFPYFVKDLRNIPVPSGTMADKIYKNDFSPIEKEEVDIDAWCSERKPDFETHQSIPLYEYCFQNYKNSFITVIWED